MKPYNQSDLFRVLLSAAFSQGLVPDPVMLRAYKDRRLARAVKALRARNLFLFTEGSRPSVNLNDITTIYTQPTGVPLMLVGYSDNLRYGSTVQYDTGVIADIAFPEAHRVRIIGEGAAARVLSEDFMFAQSGSSGQPRYTSTLLPVPLLMGPQDQIAVDLGYDTAATAPTTIAAQAFIFFSIKIRSQLTPLDYEAIEDFKRYIENNDYQRGIFLNCVTLGRDDVSFDTALAGGVATCITRPANESLLITGIGTTLRASQVMITDTSDGYSFSANRFMRSSALNTPDANNVPLLPNPGAPEAAPLWTPYYDFPVPHLLRAGASLQVDVINGGVNAAGDAIVDDQTGNVILFQGCTV